MGVDGGIASCSSQVLVGIEGDVLLLGWIVVPLNQAKVDHVDLGALSAHSHEEVVRLQVTMDHILLVQVAYQFQHLVKQNQRGVQREFSVTKVEEVLQRWTQNLCHNVPDLVVEVFPGGNQLRHSFALHVLDNVRLVGCLWISRVNRFCLDGDLLVRPNVNS